jgi:hypothetical protein
MICAFVCFACAGTGPSNTAKRPKDHAELVVTGEMGELETARVMVDGAKMEVVVDRSAGRVQLRANGTKITGRRAELLEELTAQHRESTDERLRRASALFTFFASAPGDVALRDMEVPLALGPEVDRPCVPGEHGCPEQDPGEGGGEADPCAQSWRMSGEDGVRVLPKECCTTHGGFQVTYTHDACFHPMLTQPGRCGQTRYKAEDKYDFCEGRCGVGCDAPPVYTQDCLDHDLCERHHEGHQSPVSGGLGHHPDCGDEFLEAVDDALFAAFAPAESRCP